MSRQAGFFIPLSGGIDSCATSVLVFSMCRLVYHDVTVKKDQQVLKDLLFIVGEPSTSEWRPASPQDIAGRLFHSAYMGMATNSSSMTRQRAKDLAKAIGAYHLNMDIDIVYKAILTLFTTITTFTPRYKMHGGTPATNLALQNIQARIRMVLSYLFAQLLPTVRARNAKNPESSSPGGLLVLGSAYVPTFFSDWSLTDQPPSDSMLTIHRNVDEALRGYFTKYDWCVSDKDLSSYLRMYREFGSRRLFEASFLETSAFEMCRGSTKSQICFEGRNG